MHSFNSPINPPHSPASPTIVFESGLAGPPQAWLACAKLLEPDFRVVIHRRDSGTTDIGNLAKQLHSILSGPPNLLVAHSFGALVARQFASQYPAETAGLVFVDALPLTTKVDTLRAVAVARAAELLAAFGLIAPLLPWAAEHFEPATWALAELEKLPGKDQILAEWNTREFYSSLAGLLSNLPKNLRAARRLRIPPNIPTISLHSDYPDPHGRRVENAGHWIQVDQPGTVAAAVREILSQKGV